jgi:hypothetical protein
MGKSSRIRSGFHYKPAFHQGLGEGPFDAYLAWTVADKFAWQGELTESGIITVSKPFLFGGTKDQGGVEGDLEIMFGEATQMPNAYLAATFGPQQPAWRGLTTMVWRGGRYGANNPFAQKNASKIRKILKGWDNDDPWYPEKAVIPMKPPVTFIEDLAFAATSASIGPYAGITINSGFTATDVLIVEKPAGLTYEAWSRWVSDSDPAAEGAPWSNDFWVTNAEDVTTHYWRSSDHPSATDDFATAAEADAAVRDRFVYLTGSTSYTFWLNDEPVTDNRGGLSLRVYKNGVLAINPAHMLYYMRTDSERGREPRENINEASLIAAADRLYAEGFGLCTEYDPATESPSEFEERICRVIGGSFERSLTDGQWYLDLARGDYVLEDLPILTDDDILEFKEQPTTLDRAVNSLSVRYFDPEKKETIVTPAVRALGLVRKFGEIHETLDFPEIPTGSLALRVAERELRARVTPTRGLPLVTKPKIYAWRRNSYFRLQSTKRGIADMVSIVGQKERGTLKSGAINLIATQDIYSLPDTSYVEVEPGVDPPAQVPLPIALQRADEVPYFELASRLPRAELAALPADVGYVMATASAPSAGRDFTMMVAPNGGTYDEAGTGYWCPTAIALNPVGREPGPIVVQLAEAYLLDQVEVGAPAWWESECMRVDAIDTTLLTVTLGRGCADTVPAPHAAGSRLWFYDLHAAADTTEYTDGETVDVKLLSNTGSDQLAIGLATPIEVVLNQRAYRPYPPARIRINGEASPSYLFGALVVVLAHRDRLLQADQLVDNEAAPIGPEAGTVYNYRLYVDNVLQDSDLAVAGDTATLSSAVDGWARLEVESERDGVTNWQMQVREFAYTTTEQDPLQIFGNVVTIFSDPIYME